MVLEVADVLNKPKENQPSFRKNLSFYLTEYCENTSIHGLKFLGERGRFIIEKIWWAIFIGACLYGCMDLIHQTYERWMNAPVIVSFATSETPLYRIPFPAVSICPLIKSEKSKFNFEKNLNLSDDIDLEEAQANMFKYMSLVCPNALENAIEENTTDTVGHDVNEFLFDVAPKFESTVYGCRWVGRNCTGRISELFTPIITSFGVCHTFNILDRDEIYTSITSLDYYGNISHQPQAKWTLQDGYFDSSQIKTYPRRTILIGTMGGLELVFYTKGDDIDRRCSDSLKGYKIILHHPGEIPRSHQNYFWVPLDQIVTVAVKPNMITTAAALKRYDPDARKCYFEGEKQLKFFKTYNQQNCLLECLSNYTKKKCRCVGFYMPHKSTTPICGPKKVRCIHEANIEFLTREADFQMNIEKEKRNKTGKVELKKPECHCLPSCNSLHYDAETSQMDWDWKEAKKFQRADFANHTVYLSKMRIFFKDLQFMSSERNELYGKVEFFANCGGLLGLFTGFSFISLVEILYFATLRFVCNVKKFGIYYWSGVPELLVSQENA